MTKEDATPDGINAVGSVSVEISVVLGKAVMPIHTLLRMGRGAVIELMTEPNEEVIIMANGKPVAKGDVVIHGEKIAVIVTDSLTRADTTVAAA